MPNLLRSPRNSRLGRRIILLFLLCAIAPLLIAGGGMLLEFDDLLERKDRQDLDASVRNYGMSLMGRLVSADDVVLSLTRIHGVADPDEWIVNQLGRYNWVHGVRRVRTDEDYASTDNAPPALSAQQRMAVALGGSALVVDRDAPLGVRLFLVHALPAGDLLYIEVDRAWAWGDLLEYTADSSLMLLDENRRVLVAAGEQSGDSGDVQLHREVLAQLASRGGAEAADEGADAGAGLPAAVAGAVAPRADGGGRGGDWTLSAWELFLRSRFHTPSWYVVAYKPESSIVAALYSARILFPALVVLTLLVVGALSARLIRRQLEPLARLVEGTRRLAQRDFDTPVAIAGNDEFALLGASFNHMADGLRRQFGALETLADIDRLLLRSPGLEPILDTVLPRIAEVLGCRSVSVLLIDPDADDHARAYDHRRDEGRHAAVRRIAADVTALRALLDGTPGISVSAAELRAAPVISASGDSQSQHFRLCALRHDERLSGFLCIGFGAEPGAEAATPVRADDFADRLSVVLTNLERTDRLYEQANFDPLTGLANRQMFRDELGTRLADPRASGALLYIDLDHFKNVNDSGGHSVGDELLCVVARRLQACVETGDMVARLGGDEFAVVTAGSVDGGAARTMAQRLLLAVREPLLLSGREYRVEASIGITLFPGDGRSIETLLKCSDIAMYRAKESGRGQAVFFEPAMQERMEARARLESGLYRTLERGEFALHYQPIVDVGGGEAHGVEALLRWPRSDGGSSYSPAAFVPVAEESGLIVAIGAWVLRSACTQFAQWRAQGAPVRFVSVNVSVRQLRDAGLYEQVVATLTRCGMQPGELHLEITEGVLADGERVAANLARLAELGVHLALDDFGTGFSSLSYLRRFPIHSVKIDRSFITGIPHELGACRLAESIIAMSSAIEKQVVAEGVETEEQMRFLQAAGCHFIQGFLLGRPMEATDIPGFLQRLERLRASASTPELEETARMHRAELSPRKKRKNSAAS